MKKIKSAVALGLAGTMAFSMLPGMGASAEEKTKIVISCYLADDAQVAVRERSIYEPLARVSRSGHRDQDVSDRQSLQVEVPAVVDQTFWIWTDRRMWQSLQRQIVYLSWMIMQKSTDGKICSMTGHTIPVFTMAHYIHCRHPSRA